MDALITTNFAAKSANPVPSTTPCTGFAVVYAVGGRFDFANGPSESPLYQFDHPKPMIYTIPLGISGTFSFYCGSYGTTDVITVNGNTVSASPGGGYTTGGNRTYSIYTC